MGPFAVGRERLRSATSRRAALCQSTPRRLNRSGRTRNPGVSHRVWRESSMTTTSIGSNPSAAGGITAPADPWAPDPGAQPLSDTAIDAPSGEHPLAKLGLGDLHPFALPGEATQML